MDSRDRKRHRAFPRTGSARELLAGILTLVIAAAVQISCSPQSTSTGVPIIVASVSPLAYFAERIAGGTFQVTTLVPPGTDPHHFEPSMSQLIDLDRAILYLEVGHPRLEFEAMLSARHGEDYPDLPILRIGGSLEMMAEDPHVWTSPRSARTIAETIAAKLIELAPDDPGIPSRRDALLRDIEGVHRKFAAWSARTGSSRTFISHHPAWGYLARDYKLHQTAIQMDHAEPSAARLARIIEQSRDAGVRVVLVQPGFSVESARAVAEEVGARVVTADPLGANWLQEMNQLADAFLAADGVELPPKDSTP